MSISGVSNVWLPVSDVEQSKAWYTGVLGLEARETDGEWAEVQAGDVVIGLNARDSEAPDSQGGAVIAFRASASLEDEVERLQGEGVEFSGGISEFPWGRLAAFKDPDGHDLELYEPPA